MGNLNKIDVPIALEHKSKLDLSCDHVTTMEFMQIQPVFYRHQIKGETLNIKATSIVRPAPIEVPCFGRLRQNLRAFFVPYRLVFPNWHEFYNDVIASNYNTNSLVPGVPQFDYDKLNHMFFTDPGTSPFLSTVVTTGEDFEYQGTKYKLTATGRHHLKILESLGYRLILAPKGVSTLSYNALGLLAIGKIFCDWYANSQYLNSVDVLSLERLFKFNDPSTQLYLGTTDIFNILGLVNYVVYDNEDYYVNAWDNPVSPNSGQFTAFNFADPTSSMGTFIGVSGSGTPEMFQNNATSVSVGTTYIHEALKKLTDFQKRHALAGARSIDRVLAQYGIVTDALRQNRSIYVGSTSIDVNIGSIMSTAAGTDGTNTSSIGDYAGAGFGNGDKVWEFHPDEEGIFMVLASIVPTGDLVQGFDRNNLHLDKADFFVPEFDSLGVQAIERGEVYTSDTTSFVAGAADYKGVFGFSGRYGEYKRPKSFVTGDFRLPNHYNGGNSWHLMRLFGDSSFANSVSNLIHSLSFTRGVDANQYYRMFQSNDTDYNPFFCFMHFDVGVHAPCRPLFETYEFDNEGKRVPTENGNKVN